MQSPKHASEELAIYEEMLEHLDDIVFSHDAEGRITYVSPSWKTLLKFTDAEIATLTFQELLPEEHLAEALRRTERQLNGQEVEQPWELEIYDRYRNRIWMQIRTRAVYDRSDNFVKVYGVARNIQEKKRMERELQHYTQNLEKLVEDRTRTLKESIEAYRLLVENAHDAIFITQGGKIIFANPSTLRILGLDMQTLSSIPIADLIHPEDRAQVLEYYNEKLKDSNTENLGHYTFRAVTGNNVTLWLQINAVRTIWKDKPATLNFVRDISHEKQLEQQLLQAQKMEAIGNLAGGIAHDFNNILSAIIGYTEMSLAEASAKTRIPRRLERVLEASSRAKDLVARILDFSRQTDATLRPTSVSDVVTEALDLLKASIPSTIRFIEIIEEDAGEIFADPTQIHQVVMNLCTNAACAMQASGGTMSIRLQKMDIAEEDRVTFAELSPGKYVCLSVSDTGPGIDPVTIRKIFDPYFTTKKKGEGTGLGLSVVHGIVKNIGGEIKVYSDPGKGASFHVYFPRIDGAGQRERIEKKAMPSGSETILVVDDEEFISDMLSELLSGLGYQVETRISSHEAFEAFRAHPQRFDLVITDQTMPKLTGTVLAKKIKSIRPDIPIILCSGYSIDLKNGSGHITDVTACINKPILSRELAETVRAVLDHPPKESPSPSENAGKNTPVLD